MSLIRRKTVFVISVRKSITSYLHVLIFRIMDEHCVHIMLCMRWVGFSLYALQPCRKLKSQCYYAPGRAATALTQLHRKKTPKKSLHKYAYKAWPDEASKKNATAMSRRTQRRGQAPKATSSQAYVTVCPRKPNLVWVGGAPDELDKMQNSFRHFRA